MCIIHVYYTPCVHSCVCVCIPVCIFLLQILAIEHESVADLSEFLKTKGYVHDESFFQDHIFVNVKSGLFSKKLGTEVQESSSWESVDNPVQWMLTTASRKSLQTRKFHNVNKILVKKENEEKISPKKLNFWLIDLDFPK